MAKTIAILVVTAVLPLAGPAFASPDGDGAVAGGTLLGQAWVCGQTEQSSDYVKGKAGGTRSDFLTDYGAATRKIESRILETAGSDAKRNQAYHEYVEYIEMGESLQRSALERIPCSQVFEELRGMAQGER